MRYTRIIDKDPDKPLTGNQLLCFNKRLIKPDFRFITRINSRLDKSGCIRTDQMIIDKSNIENIPRLGIAHFKDINTIMHPVSHSKTTHNQYGFNLVFQ